MTANANELVPEDDILSIYEVLWNIKLFVGRIKLAGIS